MQFSVINAQAQIEATLSASSLDEAAQKFAHERWKDNVADETIIDAPRYDVGGSSVIFIDPYLVTPAGLEREAWKKHREQFKTDVHFAPDPALSTEPRTVDTGGPSGGE